MKKETLIIDLNQTEEREYEEKLRKPAQILRAGGTVIFPTETVYGLGADATDARAASKIYLAKGRPSDNPLIVHIAELSQLEGVVREVGERERKLIAAFWPGPLTLIFRRGETIPRETTGGLDTVAVRMPSGRIAAVLIRMAGLPIAAPSANLSGRPSLTCGEYILKEMWGRVDAIIIDRDSEIGLESTVLDMTQEIPLILRPGKVTPRDIEEVLGLRIQVDASLKDPRETPKSPGMKYRHYSPKAEIFIVTGTGEEQRKKVSAGLERARKEGKKAAVITLEERVPLYGDSALSIGRDAEEASRNIFTLLRKADEMGIARLFFEALDEEGIGEALMNRMTKAAGNHRI
ncbi:MAG: L-threonylcarbamoyladenylate synthase [Peptostreptococcaceae bacterium]|nr:L-threonylcarbamoyladenylate synthase [Peptostreptococcaceae bacterium]